MSAGSNSNGLGWYLASSALFLLPGGIQIVLFPWLVVVELGAPPWQVGVAQGLAQAPMLLLIVGGVLGDRFDKRRMLVLLHAGMAVPPGLLAWLISRGQLDVSWLVLGSAAATLCMALAQPVRDALLNEVATDAVQRGVTLALGVQIVAQVIGFAFGMVADRVGAGPLLLSQSICMILGALATWLIPRQVSLDTKTTETVSLRSALAAGLRHPVLTPALGIALAVGVFFAGTFMVALPVVTGDIHGTGARGMGVAFATALAGAALLIGVLLGLGGTAHTGKALLMGAFTSGLAVMLLGAVAEEPLHFHLGLLLWGATGGLTVTMARSIVQQYAPTVIRARLLALYSMALLGGMPIGSVLMGVVMEHLATPLAMMVPGTGMLLVAALVSGTSSLWSLQQVDPDTAAP